MFICSVVDMSAVVLNFAFFDVSSIYEQESKGIAIF